MRRRQFLVLSALTPAAMALPATTAGANETARHRFGFASDGSAFLLDGKPFQIRSGELHPARIPVEYWRHRIRMAKAMGMNTIAVYVMWNYVEEREGVFDFETERRDVIAFIRLCAAEGMWVLLRPGPYVCAEWDLGGIPPYLLRHKDIKLRVRRSEDPRYFAAVQRYVEALSRRVRPLLVANGGPILMVQVENEYGSYGSDTTYLEEIRQLWISNGVPGPFYTQDGLAQVRQNHTVVPGGAIGLSGGDAAQIAGARHSFPDVPAMAGEVYPGWLTHWGEPAFAGQDSDVSAQLKGFMAGGLSFNLYMIHGGTNFGFWAGANARDDSGAYQPDITSYDYNAPITEQGAAGPRYHAYRSIVGGAVPDPLPPVPAPIPTYTSEGRTFTPTPFASLWDNLPAPLRSSRPQPMEAHGQNSGFVLYRTKLDGYTGGKLDIRWVHDYATVFVDGRYTGGFSRPRIPAALAARLNVTNDNAPLTLPPGTGAPTLDIAVEGMGRTNFGHALVDRKGILESVSLRGAELTGWEVFPLPMDSKFIETLRARISDPGRPGLFFRLAFDVPALGDTYVDMSRWTKGVVWVNGHNLGRYWTIGPQHRLFCPAPWLRRGRNELVVFDLHQTAASPIGFAATLAAAGAERAR
ncbi:beta-galactosidase [Amycolatopsis sp. NPDC059027]|uniref:beta-galactosidase n=1 Tax=Amycolatopsis sp. NPDC059027 TaxID=3346709 RepID=UPI0036734165